MTKVKDIKKNDRFYHPFCESNYLALTDWNGEKVEVRNLDGKYATVLIFGDKDVVLQHINETGEAVQNYISNKDKEKISSIVNNSPDKKLKLYLGCFNKPMPHWVNVDIRPYPETLCDVVDDILKLEKFDDNSVDEILSVHTLEHVGRYEYKDALKVWYNKLKPKGRLWLSVPDIGACCEHYIYHRDLEHLFSFFVGSQRHDYDFHKMIFDDKILTNALTEVGFTNVERYDWTKTEFAYIDSYQGCYAEHLNRNSKLLSLNMMATKP